MKLTVPFPHGHDPKLDVYGLDVVEILKIREMLLKEVKRQNDKTHTR